MTLSDIVVTRTWEESLRLRELRARMTAFLDSVDHTLRCITAYTSGPDDTDNNCPTCTALADAAQSARRETTPTT